MANCNAIKIRPRKNPIPTPASLAHNCAMKKASYWLTDGAEIIQSKSYDDYRKLNGDFNNWVKEAEQRYSNNESKKRKLRSDAVKIEEGMIIIGTDVEISNENIVNMINDFVDKFEKENDTKVRHWAYHNHEGHIDEESKEKINRHVHFLFDNVSSSGEMVRKNWKKTYFSKLQDDIYEVSKKYADIERAKKSTYHTVKIEGREVKINDKKGVHHRIYRKQKLQEQKQARQKDLKEQVKELRGELQSNKAERSDHAKLEQLNKDLKIQIQQKDLTVKEMFEKLESLKKEFLSQKEQNSNLQNEIKELESSKGMYQDVFIDAQTKIEDIQKIFQDEELKIALAELSNQDNNEKINEEEILAIIRKNSIEKKMIIGKRIELDSNSFIKDFKGLYKKKVSKNEKSINRLLKALKTIANHYVDSFESLSIKDERKTTFEYNYPQNSDYIQENETSNHVRKQRS